MNPCEVGFACPYRGYDAEFDMVCTYPVAVISADEDTPCVSPFTHDCPCMPSNSPLEAILSAYSSSVSVRNAIRRENARLNESAE